MSDDNEFHGTPDEALLNEAEAELEQLRPIVFRARQVFEHPDNVRTQRVVRWILTGQNA